ncbi:hypothetical protein BSR04_08075 [Serratia plymuthica]|nr:hypothetical protein BSR04_08075 [Serratia plymuthica]
MVVARVRLRGQQLVLAQREPQEQGRQVQPPVPLRQARPQQLVAQPPQERQRVLPPARVLRQQLARQPAHGVARLVWVSARRSACWQANFFKE